MTATPYECMKHIKLHEHGRFGGGIFYHFKRNYNYLDIKYYSKFDELKGIIEESGRENWLIFRDNVEKGLELKLMLDEIPSLRGKVYAVSAKSKGEKKYQRMIKEEKIDISITDGNDDEHIRTRVLIATSVIDNGVNFRNIQHVVISEISMVKCLQMLGRARVDENQRVTLYIKRIDEKTLAQRIESLQKRQDAYHDFKTSKSGFTAVFFKKYILSDSYNCDNPTHWIGVDEDDGIKLFINNIADSLTDILEPTYKAILEEMKKDTTNQLCGQKYLEYQLSWFGKKYIEANDITLKIDADGRSKIIKFMEHYVKNGKKLSKVAQEEFCGDCTKLIDSSFGRQDKNSNRNYKLSKLNKIFETYDIPYHINAVTESNEGTRSTFWQVMPNSQTNLSKSFK